MMYEYTNTYIIDEQFVTALCTVGNGGKVLAGTTDKKPKQSKVAQNFPQFLIKDVTLLRQTSYCHPAPTIPESVVLNNVKV